ncbi:MAG: hypothetical protein A2Z38_04110 [Planctomycetes bacterium RBG_19FT_COMBO_48_8]|nr:MAG: hypothetical protein A2Z38_04110 [Planctomycetes bacterium RBG_19FT_COMBO_48_8]
MLPPGGQFITIITNHGAFINIEAINFRFNSCAVFILLIMVKNATTHSALIVIWLYGGHHLFH